MADVRCPRCGQPMALRVRRGEGPLNEPQPAPYRPRWVCTNASCEGA